MLLCAAYPLRSAEIQWQQIKGGNVQAFFSENAGIKQVTVTSESGYALYRYFDRLPAGKYVLNTDARWEGTKGAYLEIYGFSKDKKHRALLIYNLDPAQQGKGSMNFTVPAGYETLRIGVGLNCKGTMSFSKFSIRSREASANRNGKNIPEANLLPSADQWYIGKDSPAQTVMKKENGTFHVTVTSESGYAFYRYSGKFAPGTYTLTSEVSGNSVAGGIMEVYSFDRNGKHRLLLWKKSAAGNVSGEQLTGTFEVPADSERLRISVGISGRGELIYRQVKMFAGKVVIPQKKTKINHPAAEKWLAKWIWFEKDPGLPKVVFTKDIQLESPPAAAMLQLTADNGYVLKINNRIIGSDVDWKSVEIFDVSSALKSGKNTISVEVINYDGAGGLLLQGLISDDQKVIPLMSDESWHVSRPDGTPEKVKILGSVPLQPWGNMIFHRISPPDIIRITPEKKVAVVTPGEVLKFVYKLDDRIEKSKNDLGIRFFDASGRNTPLAGLPLTIRAEKKVKQIFIELATSIFAAPGVYRAEIYGPDFIIPAGEVVVRKTAVPAGTGAKIPRPSDKNFLETPFWKQSLFIYATNTPSPEHFRNWTHTGGHLYETSITSGQWMSNGRFDTSACEKRVLEILENDPHASVIVKFTINVPGWWVAANPGEIFVSNRNRSTLQSFCSEKWHHDAVKAVGDAIEELAARPAGKAISGVLLMGFDGGEFQLWGQSSGEYDCSPAAKREWKKFLRQNNMPVIELPHPALEWPFKENNPEYSRIRETFFRFISDRHADNIIGFARKFKARFGEKYLFGVYFGYPMEHSSSLMRLLYSGHLGIEKVLAEAPLDLISCPLSYGLRPMHRSHAAMNPVDSARLHNIMPIIENDIRNYRNPEFGDASGWSIFSLRDSIADNRRLRLFSAAKGALVRYYAIINTADFYADQAIVRDIRKDDQLVMELQADEPGSPGQVALVIAPMSWVNAWKIPQKTVTAFASDMRDTLMRTGREMVSITLADYLAHREKFPCAVIVLPGLLGVKERAALAVDFSGVKTETGALVLNNGKKIIADVPEKVWEAVATEDALRAGFNTVWYVGKNFRYQWKKSSDGEYELVNTPKGK